MPFIIPHLSKTKHEQFIQHAQSFNIHCPQLRTLLPRHWGPPQHFKRLLKMPCIRIHRIKLDILTLKEHRDIIDIP